MNHSESTVLVLAKIQCSERTTMYVQVLHAQATIVTLALLERFIELPDV